MKHKYFTFLLMTLVVILNQPVIAKCNGGKTKGDIFKNWTLVKLPNFSTAQINTIGTIIPNIHFTDGQVIGFGGCNQLRGGKYTIKNDKIKLSNIASTRKMCVGIESDVEKEFIALLNKAERYKVEGKKMVIFTSDGQEIEFTTK